MSPNQVRLDSWLPGMDVAPRQDIEQGIMMRIRKSEERGHASHGWLDSYHTFSFADYYDPKQMHFRSLRVINEDRIAGGGGFGTHPHRDMEIITVMLGGALEHQDSMGNGSVIRPGQVQYMAAGTGVKHSEFNPSPTEEAHLLQIWIMPAVHGAPPRYEEKSFASPTDAPLQLIASNTGRAGSIAINQDADLFVGRLQPGDTPTHEIAPGRGAWVQILRGELTVNGESLRVGDGAALTAEAVITLVADKSAELLLFDLA